MYSKNLAFSKAGETAGKVLRIADQAGIHVKIQQVDSRQNSLSPVLEKLY